MPVFTSPILMQSLILFCHNLWAECALQERNFFTIYLHRTFSKSMFPKLVFPKAPFPEAIKCCVSHKTGSQRQRKSNQSWVPKTWGFFSKLCQNSLPVFHVKSFDILTLQHPINLCFYCLFSTRFVIDKLRIWKTTHFSPFYYQN